MIKYITEVSEGAITKIDTESLKAKLLYNNFSIDYGYYIEEAGEFIINKEDSVYKTFNVVPGDIVIKLYSIDGDYSNKEYLILHDDRLIDYVNRKKENREKMKEEGPCMNKVCCER